MSNSLMLERDINNALYEVEDQYVLAEQDRLVVFLSAAYIARDVANGEPNGEVHQEPLTLSFTHHGERFDANILPNIRWIMWEMAQRSRGNLLKIGREDIVTRAEHYVFEKFGKPTDGTQQG